MNASDMNTAIAELAATLQGTDEKLDVWTAFEHSLGRVFGHRLFTVLVFDAKHSRLRRLHSTRPEVNPVGGAKAVTDSPWVANVLRGGNIYIGSTKEDIASVFSEHAALHGIGCDSVLNIPVRHGGTTIGTINLLDAAGCYDGADHAVVRVYAALAAAPMLDVLLTSAFEPIDDAALEHV